MYTIVDYDKRYKPYDKSGGDLKHADWVKMPANPKGDGLETLLEYKRGVEVFAVWCLLLQKATVTKKPENRGKLLNHKDEAASIPEIAKGISMKGKEQLVEHALSVLVSVGWVEFDGIAEETSEEFQKVPPKSSVEKSSVEKSKYMDFVFLTKAECEKLVNRFGRKRTIELIEELNNGIGSKDYKYKSHYFTILKWAGSGTCRTSGCGRKGDYVGEDDTGQKVYRCDKHKPRRKPEKPLLPGELTTGVLKKPDLREQSVSDKRNRQMALLKEK